MMVQVKPKYICEECGFDLGDVKVIDNLLEPMDPLANKVEYWSPMRYHFEPCYCRGCGAGITGMRLDRDDFDVMSKSLR